MRHRSPRERRCTYLVVLDAPARSSDELRELAAYLTELAVANFEVLIIDATAGETLEENRRIVRWVGRYVVARPNHYGLFGNSAAVGAALDLSRCDKVIVAAPRVRYSAGALDDLTALLEVHEVVEPQDYFDPLP